MFKLAIPVLHVSDSAVAEGCYCDRLEFARLFVYRPGPDAVNPAYIGMQRDGVTLHVSSFPGDGVSGGAVNFVVDNVDVLHAEFVAKGVAIQLPPTDQTWANREMYLKDADGNSLRFIRAG